MPTAPQRTPAFDGNAAANAITARAYAEGWDIHDIRAASLQSSLLLYRSGNISAEERARSQWNQVWNPDGSRYVDSAPEHYKRNCPWNDWTPPSQSRALFEQAQANRIHEPIDLRVRVRVSDEPTPVHASETQVAFVSIENNEEGKKCLVIRRGAIVLSSMAISSLHAEGVSQNLLQVVLTATLKNPVVPTASLCLTFEKET